MHIEQVGLAPSDTGKIRACFEVSLAAERVDDPSGAVVHRAAVRWLDDRRLGR